MAVQRWEIDQSSGRQPAPGAPVARVVIGSEAGCRTGLIEVAVAPGGTMPEHEHGASEVLLIMRAGHVRLISAADGTVTNLDRDGVLVIPAGERVRLENPGEVEARLLVVLTPAAFADAVETWPEAA